MLLLLSSLAVSQTAWAADLTIAEQAAAIDVDVDAPDASGTSSPRDTLRTFLHNAEAVYDALLQDRFDDVSVPRSKAAETLDFSQTDNGIRWDEQVIRMLYLKEILDRTVLPDWGTIPGREDLVGSEVEKWRIPDTEITLSQVQSGDRKGEYLFSAGTVAYLHALYRQVEALPYRPGSTPKFLETYRQKFAWTIAERIRERLQPVDNSSPRQLFDGFLANVNDAYQVVMDAKKRAGMQPSGLGLEEAREAERLAGNLIERAIETLDLSDIPLSFRLDSGRETVLMLKEIIDRSPLPPQKLIPGPNQIQAIRELGNRVRWRLPDTDIEIAEITQGPDAGLFRFSSATVSRVKSDYDKVADLPYRGELDQTGAESRFVEQYQAAGISPGFYDYYISTPGMMVPAASRLAGLIDLLPPFMNRIYRGQTIWQWLLMVGSLLTLVFGLIAVQHLGRRLSSLLGDLSASWFNLVLPLVCAVIVLGLMRFVDETVNATGSVMSVIVTISYFLITLFLSAAVYRLVAACGEVLVSLPTMRQREFDSNLVRVVSRVIGFLIALAVAVNGFSALGVELLPLIASLGVGGLAVALAVRPTLENMIGGLIIYADKPVEVGDFCTFGQQQGTVESVGLRSTRIRALDRSMITVPNSVFADMQIVNFARCDTMLISTVIGLRYETSMEQLRNIIAKMRRICLAHPKIESETLRVRFSGFGPSSLDIGLRLYALTNEWNEFHAIREDLFFRFAEAIEEAGSGIAFPSTTVYMSKDTGIDEERRQKAEAEVAAWREADELPFPSTPERLARRIRDTLDFPPKGSPQAAGKRAVEQEHEQLGRDEE